MDLIIKNNVLEKCVLDANPEKEIIIPEGVEVINGWAFAHYQELTSIKLPNTLKKIENNAFANCGLREVNLPVGIKELSGGVFSFCENLTSIVIPEGVESIGGFAFHDCINLESVELPLSLDNIGRDIFSGCKNLNTIIIAGKKINVTRNMLENIKDIYPFLKYCAQNNKFIPKSLFVMKHTPAQEIENFYKHANRWKEILNIYVNKWRNSLEVNQESELMDAVENLYQTCIVLGVFQDGKIGEEALSFIKDNIVTLKPHQLHQIFGAFNTKAKGFIEEYAMFYMKNFKPQNENELFFMHVGMEWEEFFEKSIINYTAQAYNNWDKVKEVYPNKTVLAHREQGSENNNLSFEDILTALNKIFYTNVNEGNEEMADVISGYGYTQETFEMLQSWWDEGKNISDEQMILRAGKDTETDGVVFELMSKNNIETLILGELTNCCQTAEDAGAECLRYGVTKTNSAFIKFSVNGKICGQSWVWYNEKTGVVCLDNIEIPTIWNKQLHKPQFQKSFMDCLVRLAQSIKETMKQNGNPVKMVTIGAGYNDLPGLDEFQKLSVDATTLPSDYSCYSDATRTQYVIPERHKIKIDEGKL